MSIVLQTRNLGLSFGHLAVLDGVSMRLTSGARHAVIGPNGAGKTTLINVLAGTLTPDRGSVLLDGNDITRMGVAQRVKHGLVRTFQVNRLFAGLSPRESLTLALCEREGWGARWWRSLSRAPVHDEASYWLEKLRLLPVQHMPAAQLDYGQQRLLDIALALVCRPRVLLLDEPAAGLPASQRNAMMAVLKGLPGDVSIVLIEHDMNLVFGFADTISVLVQGRVLARGTPDEIRAHRDVRAVYLGQARDALPLGKPE